MNKTKPHKPTLLYDGDCGFCKAWVEYWHMKTQDTVVYRPYQSAVDAFAQVDKKMCKESVQLIVPTGEVQSGANAVFTALSFGGTTKWRWLYDNLPGFSILAEMLYRLVANNRSFFHSVTSRVFGIPLKPSNFVVSTWLFVKSIGVIYLIAFLSFWAQADGLIGSNGILPVGEFIQNLHASLGSSWVLQEPTLFGIVSADWMIVLVAAAGVAFALALIAGIAPRISLVALFVLYVSIVNGGQIFFSYQWDMLLLEAGFLAMFISFQSNIIIYLFWWLLARVMISSGAVKLLSGDESWRNFTALTYHYQTQPLPTVFSYVFDTLPRWFHAISAVTMYVIEFGAAILLFFGRKIRMAAAGAILGLQVFIGVTGNYTFFNMLTAALVLVTFDDAFWKATFESIGDDIIDGVSQYGLGWPMAYFSFPLSASVALYTGIVVLVCYGAVSTAQFWTTLQQEKTPGPVRSAASISQSIHIANSYGLFAVMTRKRPEIILEGSHDTQQWRAYDFKFKPDDLTEAPAWIQPHQPRLDWQMWFAALRGDVRQSRWFLSFVRRLLDGSDAVTSLIGTDPFPNKPPQYIRARIFEYEYSTIDTLLQEGRWWQRENERMYLPPVSLQVQDD